MHVPINPKQKYWPSEIADNGFILNSKGKKDYRYILRLIERGKLRAEKIITGPTSKAYKVLGEDIIVFKKSTGVFTIPKQPEEYQHAPKEGFPLPQPPADNE